MALDILLAQTPIRNENKIKELDYYLNLANKENINLAIFPEGYLNLNRNKDLLKQSIKIIKENKINTLLGVINSNQNSAYFVDYKGNIVGKYLKRCLFADEKEKFEGGKEPFIFNIKGYKISPLICYDLFFPELSRELMNLGVEIIPVLSTIREERRSLWYSVLETRANENNIPFLASCGIYKQNKLVGGSAIARPREKVIKIKGKGYLISKIEPEKYKKFRENESPLERGKNLFDKNIFGPYIKDIKLNLRNVKR